MCNPPFEPIRETSLKFLTFKTVFLITLASGRRRSEVHALSGLGRDISFEQDGSVSLHFLPDFLAKNQQAGTSSPLVQILPLSSILCDDDEDRQLCPVCALKRYLAVTRGRCSPPIRHLFLSLNAEYKKDIRKSTLARWLVETIKLGYKASGTAVPSSTRPHKIRALSASLALTHSVPLSKILEAAYWRSEGTFMRFYLRDARRLWEDGSFGVSSIIVAQSQVYSSSTV